MHMITIVNLSMGIFYIIGTMLPVWATWISIELRMSTGGMTEVVGSREPGSVLWAILVRSMGMDSGHLDSSAIAFVIFVGLSQLGSDSAKF